MTVKRFTLIAALLVSAVVWPWHYASRWDADREAAAHYERPSNRGVISLQLDPDLIQRLDAEVVKLRLIEDGDGARIGFAGVWRVLNAERITISDIIGRVPGVRYRWLVVDREDGSTSWYPILINL